MSITITEFDKMGEDLADVNAKLDALKLQMKPLQEWADKLEAQIMDVLKEQGKTSYRFAKIQVVLSHRSSVQTPKTREEKEAFFEYLRKTKGEEVMWHYIGVNSNSLNAYYREEFKAAMEAQNLDFKIPGVGKESIMPILSVKKIG